MIRRIGEEESVTGRSKKQIEIRARVKDKGRGRVRAKVKSSGKAQGLIGSNLVLSLLLCFLLPACASYQVGYTAKRLPDGYKEVAIPIFKNKTSEVGIETYFTSAIIKSFVESKTARVTTKDVAPITIEGTITKLDYVPSNQIEGDCEDPTSRGLPCGSVLTTSYRVFLFANLKLRRNSDRKIIWEGGFQDERVYSAPIIGMPVLNAANPLYNQVAHHQVIEKIAQDMMVEAYNRLTEDF